MGRDCTVGRALQLPLKSNSRKLAAPMWPKSINSLAVQGQRGDIVGRKKPPKAFRKFDLPTTVPTRTCPERWLRLHRIASAAACLPRIKIKVHPRWENRRHSSADLVFSRL